MSFSWRRTFRKTDGNREPLCQWHVISYWLVYPWYKKSWFYQESEINFPQLNRQLSTLQKVWKKELLRYFLINEWEHSKDNNVQGFKERLRLLRLLEHLHIVQTFPKYCRKGFHFIKLSLLSPILAKFQFCWFSGLFWASWPPPRPPWITWLTWQSSCSSTFIVVKMVSPVFQMWQIWSKPILTHWLNLTIDNAL